MERKERGDNTKQWRQERKRLVPDKTKKLPKKVKPSKVFIYALALAALGGGGYLVYDRLRRKKLITSDDAGGSASDTILINNYVPATTSTAVTSKSTKGNDSFPLKRGSRGTRVATLQQGLARIIGSAAMTANGGIDGQFGPGTANALKLAGYGEVVDEAAFSKITGGVIAQIVFNPADIALRLYRAAQGKDVSLTLAILKEIGTVSEYSAVSEYYKRQGLVSKTIVNDLLSYAFAANESAKGQIKTEFLRMGLKMDSAGTWSLQGLRLYKDLITLRSTVVTDSRSRRIPVQRNTILGDEIKIENGLTWFRSVDDSVLSVPTQDVRYT